MKQLIDRYRGLAGLFSSNLLNNAVTFISVIILSKLIIPEEFGIFTLCVSIMMTSANTIDFGTNLSFVRWYNLKDTSVDRNSLYGAIILIRLCTTTALLLLAFPLTILLKNLLMKQVGYWTDIFIALVAASIFGWWTLVRAVRQAQQNHSRYSKLTVIFAIIRLAVVPSCYLLSAIGSRSFIIGLYLLSPLAIVLFEAFSERSKLMAIRPFSKKSRAMAKGLIVYGKWPFISTVLFPLVSSAPVWVMASLNNFNAAGAYGVGLTFANVLAPLRDAIRVFMFPKMVGFASRNQARELLARLKCKFPYIPLIAVAVSLFAMLAQKVIHGDSYENAYIVIIIMVATQVITVFSSIIGIMLHYFGKPHVDTTVNIFRVAISLSLSILMVPRYGVIGAATAASFSILIGEYLIYKYVSRQLSI